MPPELVRLVTYNVDMRRQHLALRMEAIASEVERLDPDVVGFQEVTTAGLEALRGNAWFRSRVLFPEPDGAWSRHEYRTFLSSREPLLEPRCRSFANSRMGRDLVCGRLQSDPELMVGTTHLESLARWTAVRLAQLETSLEWLSSSPSAILMGDFNLMTGRDPEPIFPGGWHDAWFSLDRPHFEGLTYDARLNPLARSHRQRLDRIFCRPGGRFDPIEMSLLGRSELEPGVLPSDYFGLFCEFRYAPPEEHGYWLSQGRRA